MGLEWSEEGVYIKGDEEATRVQSMLGLAGQARSSVCFECDEKSYIKKPSESFEQRSGRV